MVFTDLRIFCIVFLSLSNVKKKNWCLVSVVLVIHVPAET